MVERPDLNFFWHEFDYESYFLCFEKWPQYVNCQKSRKISSQVQKEKSQKNNLISIVTDIL